MDSDWGNDDDDALDVKFTDLNLCEDANGNVASGAEAIESDIAVAQVESDQIQEIIIETPDEDLLANNTMIPELFSKANNAEKRTGNMYICTYSSGNLKPVFSIFDYVSTFNFQCYSVTVKMKMIFATISLFFVEVYGNFWFIQRYCTS